MCSGSRLLGKLWPGRAGWAPKSGVSAPHASWKSGLSRTAKSVGRRSAPPPLSVGEWQGIRSVLRVRGLGSRGYGGRLAVEGPRQDFASKHLASQTVLHTDGAQAYAAPVPNLELRHDTVSHSTKKGGPFFVKNCTHKGVPPTA